MQKLTSTGSLHFVWIAIDRYASPLWPTLKNAVSGSEALEALLSDKFGSVDEHTIALTNQNATLAEIERTLRSFAPGGSREVGEDDQLILSFAGHGEEDTLTNETAFIPFDGDPESTFTWFRFDQLRPLLRVINAKHILVISDSCFSGGVFRSASQLNNDADTDAEYARRAFKKSSRQMISSGGAEKTIDGGGRPGRSVFIEGLLQGLRMAEPDWLLANKLFRDTRSYVVANAEQTPEFGPLSRSGHGGGEFVLFSKEVINFQIEENAHVQDAAFDVLADSSVDASPHAQPTSTEIQTTDTTPPVSHDPEEDVSAEHEKVVLKETSREPKTGVKETIQSVAKNWSARKAEVQSRFGMSFELVDEIDIQEFWQIIDDRPHKPSKEVELAPKKGVSLISMTFLFVYVHFVYLSFNLWVSDFLTVGAALYPMMVLIPLFHLAHKRYRSALAAYTIIFATFFIIMAVSGTPLEHMLGIRPEISYIGASTSLIKVSMALELLTVVFISAVLFSWFKYLKIFVRFFLATSIALFFATGVYYFTGYGSRIDALGTSVTRYNELVPLLGFGTPVEKHINWFARDTILYLIISAISTGLIVLVNKRRSNHLID